MRGFRDAGTSDGRPLRSAVGFGVLAVLQDFPAGADRKHGPGPSADLPIRLWGGGARTQRCFGRLWKGWPATDNLRPERHRATFGARPAGNLTGAGPRRSWDIHPRRRRRLQRIEQLPRDRTGQLRINTVGRRPVLGEMVGAKHPVPPRQHRRVIAVADIPSRRGANGGIPGSRAATPVAQIASGCSHG